MGPSGESSTVTPGGGEPVAHGVRDGEVAAGPGLLPLCEEVADQRVQCGRGGLVRSCDHPVGVERVEAEHGRHGAHGRGQVRRGDAVARVQRGVALAHGAVHDRERARGAQVVVQRGGERRGDLRCGLGPADPLANAVHERLDPPERGHRLVERRVGVLDHRAVVRGHEVVAQLGAAHPAQQRVDGQRVAQRLAHLLPAQGHPGVVQPEPRERVARRVALGALVLVVREDEVDAAAVDVELRAQVERGHRRALQVPARPSPAPRRRPRRLARLGGLPQREVAGIALAEGLGLALHDVVEPLAGQRAVAGEGPHVEVDVAARGVGVPGVDQPLHELDHLRDVPGRPRLDRRRQAAQRVVGREEFALVGRGPLPPRPAGRSGLA